MDISIVISTFRRPDLLRQTLQSFSSLKTSALRWEVLVVDNAGDERTRETVRNFSDQLRIKYLVEIKSGKNNALSRAIPEAHGEIIVFTDDDIVADPKWLVEIWEGIKRWPEYHVFGGRILPKWPKGQGMLFEHPFLKGAYTIADWDIPEGCYPSRYVWGPNMAIRASIFQAGWRFNPNIGPDGSKHYTMGSETDLTTRLEQSGFKAIYLPRSLVFHQIRSEQMTTKWLYGRAFRYGREVAYEQGTRNGHLLFGIPRYMIRQVCEAFVMFMLYKFSRDKKSTFDRGLLYWRKRGMISESRAQFKAAHF